MGGFEPPSKNGRPGALFICLLNFNLELLVKIYKSQIIRLLLFLD
jgi:hypothetical protein